MRYLTSGRSFSSIVLSRLTLATTLVMSRALFFFLLINFTRETSLSRLIFSCSSIKRGLVVWRCFRMATLRSFRRLLLSFFASTSPVYVVMFLPPKFLLLLRNANIRFLVGKPYFSAVDAVMFLITILSLSSGTTLPLFALYTQLGGASALPRKIHRLTGTGSRVPTASALTRRLPHSPLAVFSRRYKCPSSSSSYLYVSVAPPPFTVLHVVVICVYPRFLFSSVPSISLSHFISIGCYYEMTC